MLPGISSKRFHFVLCAVLSAFGLTGTPGCTPRASAQALKLHATRTSPNDLELLGLPGHAHAFLTHTQLETLPQRDVTITDSPDYPNETLHFTGILLESLIQALHPPANLDLVDANCTDRYHSIYTANYIATHHPILVLASEHQPLAQWASATHHYDPSPYLVVYEHFKPAFRVLSHDDEPLVPTNLSQLRFTSTARIFAPLAPPPGTPENSPAQQGFLIAKQNCLRCHSGGPEHAKSTIGWSALSRTAREHPAFFGSWIHNSQAISPKSKMPPFPEYDAPTLEAITAYFQSISPTTSRRASSE